MQGFSVEDSGGSECPDLPVSPLRLATGNHSLIPPHH
jgi:hypothetical protein